MGYLLRLCVDFWTDITVLQMPPVTPRHVYCTTFDANQLSSVESIIYVLEHHHFTVVENERL